MQETFKLEGMTCQGCADPIQNGLNEQSFIDKAIYESPPFFLAYSFTNSS